VLRRCAACTLVYSAEYADPSEIYVDGYLRGNTDWGLDVMGPLFQRYLRHCAEIRFRRIERVVPPGRLLDVGCGTGEVMLVARERGWRVQGVEPVSDSVEFATEERDLDIRKAFLEDSGLPERSYDVVSAFHVLEHLQDGVSFLRLLARWAKPGGHVVVEVPNWRSFHRRAFGGAWPHLRPQEHLAHYTTATLRGALERAGLEPVRVTTPGFVWSGQTLDQQLLDLGLQRFRRAASLAGRPGSASNRAAVAAVQAVYDKTNTGMVILAVAKVA
jgi:spore maturation protein CgeB